MPRLRLATLAVLVSGCLSGSHLANGKLYETKATARVAWKAIEAHLPDLHHDTQVLAIAIHSNLGTVQQLWSDGAAHTYVARTGMNGPYGIVGVDGHPLALGDARAQVLELGLPPGPSTGMVLRPSRVKIVTSANPTRALEAAAARWYQLLTDQEPAIIAALDATGNASAGRPLGPETTSISEGYAPTWVPSDHRFVVVYVRTITRSSSLVERRKTEAAPCSKHYPMPLPGFPDTGHVQVSCAPTPDHVDVVHTRSYSIDVALALEYSADGARTFERWYPPDPHPAKGPY